MKHAAKRVMDLRVVGKSEWNRSVLLVLAPLPGDSLPPMEAGQFVQVKVDNSPSTYLRRPISVHFVDEEAQTLSLLIQKIGEGTRHMAALGEGDTLNVMLPLGKGFTLPSKEESGKMLLVGGGVGTAPLLYLGKKLKESGLSPVFLLGGRSAGDLLQLDAFARYGEVLVTTEDGSLGLKGLVTMHPVMQDKSLSRIYCCGPKPMMKAVANVAKQAAVWCEVSLENTMACGLGACLCCVENTVEGHRCVCQDGPVFNINQLPW